MDIFNGMAGRYDRPERVQVAERIAEALRPGLANCAEKDAIDYGCGTGLVGLQLTDCVKSMLLVDAAPQMVEQVREKIARLGIPNAGALCADFLAEVPPGLTADVIIVTQVLLHIPDTAAILRRFFEVLNPGGRLLVVDFDKNEAIADDRVHNGFVQGDLIALARQAGFGAAEAHTFYHGQNIFMNMDASLFLLAAEKPAG